MFILKQKLKPSIQKRSLRAFLDLVILRMITHKPMTAYELNSLFVKKFGIIISPATVYSKLSSMEREGLITCVQYRPGRTYSITEQGRKIVDSITSITEEIQDSIKLLLRS